MPNLNMKDILKYIIKNVIDDLNRLLGTIYLILFIPSLLIRNFYLDIIEVLLFVIFIFRLFSKDKTARYKENEQYLKIKNKLFHPFSSSSKKDEHSVYKRCRACNTILKLPLPKKIGINHAKCPNCQKRLTIINFRKKRPEKVRVEVIKKKRG